MSIDWNYYTKVMSSSSDVIDKQDLISKLQTNMTSELQNNYISEYDIKIGMAEYRRTVKVNFTKDIIVALKDERFKEQIYDALAISILSAPNQCDSGDYISMTVRDTEDIYLVRAEPNKKRNHDKLMLLQCQHNVKILDDDGVTIHNYPFFFSDNKSRPQINVRSEVGVTDSSTYQGYVRHDAISRRFIANTNNKQNRIDRIMIDGIVYRIAGFDALSAKGLFTLGLEVDTYDSTKDNLELGIADYYNNVAGTPSADMIVGDSELCIGETNTYSIATNNTFTWGLTDNGITATLGLSGKNCTVTSKFDTKLIGKTVTLTATLDIGTVYSKVITITGLV